jgi:CHASE2 domain-containing sensor protein
MRGNGLGRAGGRAIRVLRWQPHNHRQVWLITAGIALIILLAWFAIGSTWPELVSPVIALAASGAIMSYRLDRRQDARVASDWASSRRQAGR